MEASGPEHSGDRTSLQVDPLTLDAASEVFLLARRVEGVSRKTLDWYEYILHDVGLWLADRASAPTPPRVDLRALTLQDLWVYVDWLRTTRHVSPATVRGHIVALQVVWKFLHAQRLLPANPAAALKRPELPRSYEHVFAAEQVRRLLAAPDKRTYEGYRDYVMLALLFDTGIRLAELMGLRVVDFDPRMRAIAVTGKRGRARTVPISKMMTRLLVVWLRRRCAVDFEDALWTIRAGTALAREQFRKRFKQYAHAAKIGGVRASPHTLRHTYATQALEGGADLFHVRQVLGHQKLETVEAYIHKTARHLRDAHDRSSPLERLRGN